MSTKNLCKIDHLVRHIRDMTEDLIYKELPDKSNGELRENMGPVSTQVQA
jgi:hypothetical protein